MALLRQRQGAGVVRRATRPGCGTRHRQFTLTPALFGDVHCAGAGRRWPTAACSSSAARTSHTHVGIHGHLDLRPAHEHLDRAAPTWPTPAGTRRCTTLADGRALVRLGRRRRTGTRVDTPEVYDPATDTWTRDRRRAAPGPLPVHVPAARRQRLRGGHETRPRSSTRRARASWSAGPTAPFGTSATPSRQCDVRPGKILRAGGGDPAMDQTAVIDMNAAAPEWGRPRRWPSRAAGRTRRSWPTAR